jgi:predicted dehydrogenase
MEEFELTAVAERHARKAADRYPHIKSYSSVANMLSDENLELVVVNTPNITHYGYAKKALLAEKHVVVEKPFTATSEQAKELINLAEKYGKLLAVFQNRRWDSDFLAVQQVVKGQRLGKLIEAEFHYDRYRMELSPKKHKEKADPGVGLIYDLGPHLIDQAITLFGKPQGVFARIQHHRPGSLVDDYFMIHLLYPDFNCTLKSSLLIRESIPAFVLHGTNGSFQKPRADVQEADLKKGRSPCTSDWGKEPDTEKGLLHTEENGVKVREYLSSPRGCYQNFYHGIYHSLRKNAVSPVLLEDSLLNIQIIEAALESQKNTAVVALN